MGAKYREVLTRYIFRRGSTLKEFEASVITGLLGVVMRRDDIDRISIKRVVIYSAFCNVLTLAVLFAEGGELSSSELIGAVNDNLILLPVATLLALPFDAYSISVSKNLFYYQVYPVRYLPGLIVLDLLQSLIPLLAAWFLAWWVIGSMEYLLAVIFIFMLTGLIGSFVGSVFITAVQLIVLAGGLLLRGSFAVMRTRAGSRWTSLAERLPVTFCFIVFAVGVIVLDLATRLL